MSRTGTNPHTAGGKQAGVKVVCGPNFGEDLKGTFADRGINIIGGFRAKPRQYGWYFKQ
jgi:hypothetical protein